jgi:sterol desaturase/sphingolipid hydroxylase (fatty acid hydroxylase superfamily)
MSSVVVAPSRSRAPRIGERGEREAGRFRSALASRVYLPAFAIPAAAAVLIALGWSAGWGEFDFGASTTSLREIVLGPLTAAIIAVFLVVERVRPAQRRPLVARGHRQDVLYTALNVTLVVPFVTALTLSFVQVARTAAPWIVLPRIGTVPRWGAIALLVVAMDGCNWFVHLINHRSRMLWRFHELHHSQEDMSVLTVFRTHPLVHVSFVLALIPSVVLLANGTASTAVLVVYAAIVAFAHSNTNMGFGPLERLFVSPNYHRIHHKVDGPGDVNLGFALTIWDRLSGRAVAPTEDTIRTDTGLMGRPLVVEQAGGRPRHLAVFAAQLVAPFRPVRGASDAPPVRSAMPPAVDGAVDEAVDEAVDGSDREPVGDADLVEARVASW